MSDIDSEKLIVISTTSPTPCRPLVVDVTLVMEGLDTSIRVWISLTAIVVLFPAASTSSAFILMIWSSPYSVMASISVFIGEWFISPPSELEKIGVGSPRNSYAASVLSDPIPAKSREDPPAMVPSVSPIDISTLNLKLVLFQ